MSLTNLDPGGVGFDNFSFNEFTTEPGLDTDGDGVPDDQDVCAGGNDLEDVDGDRVPDSCDLCPFDPDNDADEDGLCAFDEAGPLDTCPFDPGNDADEDGLCALDQTGAAPDACPFDPDNDADQDGLCGEVDNCPASANPDQTGTDGDLEGDACDLDDDDGVEDTAENCVLHANPDQSDRDGDSAGDVCDADRDGDGVGDDADSCLLTQTGDVVDATGCSVADRCPCGNEWKNHGAYLSCVGRTARNFVGGGLITVLEEGAINSAAVNSQCGERR